MAKLDEARLQFTPEEMSFLAESEKITIVPNFSLPSMNASSINCMAGTVGPFQPDVRVEVPLWLALTLHKRKKCKVQAPEWMSEENLRDVLDQEQSTTAYFQALPFRYLEVAHMLFTYAKDTFGADIDKVRDLVGDVRKERFAKIHSGLSALEGMMTVKLNNLAAMEVNVIRGFFRGALDRYARLEQLQNGLDDS